MSPEPSVQNYWKQLQESYSNNVHDVHTVQSILIDQILPAMKSELGLDQTTFEESKHWLEDTSSVFHFLRRNTFTRSFAMETMRKTLLWRLAQRNHLYHPCGLAPAVLALPNSFDFLGRPIAVFQLSSFQPDAYDVKSRVIKQVEQLRVNLQRLSKTGDCRQLPLQYVIILDCSSLSARNLNVELMSWTIREVMPRFPGLFACAFIINYSWPQAGIWNIAKHLLSSNALSKIMHLSTEELLDYCDRSVLPADYGGDLPTLSQLQSHQVLETQPLDSSHEYIDLPMPITTPGQAQNERANAPGFLSPISFLNPFFGYPTQAESAMKHHRRESSRHTLRHGRRRKRDLAKTLLLLLWMRWRRRMGYLVAIILFAFLVRVSSRRWRSWVWKFWEVLVKPK